MIDMETQLKLATIFRKDNPGYLIVNTSFTCEYHRDSQQITKVLFFVTVYGKPTSDYDSLLQLPHRQFLFNLPFSIGEDGHLRLIDFEDVNFSITTPNFKTEK